MNDGYKRRAIDWIGKELVYAQWCIQGECGGCPYKVRGTCKRDLVEDLAVAHEMVQKLKPLVCKVRPVKKEKPRR